MLNEDKHATASENHTTASESYAAALAILKDALRFGIDPTLENVALLTAALGNPEQRYQVVQVAGTNGKTSTVRFIAAILRAAGKHVGLYTSPELVYSEERIEIAGRVVAREMFARAILTANEAAERLISEQALSGITEFELLTAAALWLFADQGVDFAVLEVGLGGRWDATSIVQPAVAAITGVDFDHTDILGNTIEEIAGEKAAIIKPGSKVVLGSGVAPARQVFLQQAASVGANPVQIAEYPPYLQGVYSDLHFAGPGYQAANIACALAACEAALGYAPEPEVVQQALDALSIPGRFELLRDTPPLLIDAAHNPQSARYLVAALKERYGKGSTLDTLDTLLIGVLADKDAEGIIAPLVSLFEHLAVTQSASSRAIPAAQLAEIVERLSGRSPEIFTDVAGALEVLSERGSGVLATGSITIAGEVKRIFLETNVLETRRDS